MAIDSGRVVLGGLVAGLVMNVVDATANGMLLGGQWTAETNALNPALLAKATSSSTIWWVVLDFLAGVAIVWTYAAIRPRFGAGPGTAMKAALLVWFVLHIMYASYVTMGLYSASLIGLSSLAGLVAAVAGGYAGAMLYRETP
ncbi:MAG: hypothetical protein H0U85_06760 [Gemmatimonadales bacterium]|nr:hypothetical protein [Gemmatimonadales bacterium]